MAKQGKYKKDVAAQTELGEQMVDYQEHIYDQQDKYAEDHLAPQPVGHNTKPIEKLEARAARELETTTTGNWR